MRPVGKVALTVCIGALLAWATAPDASSQSRSRSKVVTTHAQVARADAKDENVTDDSEVNGDDAVAANPRPPEKGGGKPRGPYCGVLVDNYTPYMARVYVDGTYRGTVSPWGGLTVTTLSGGARLYAKASFGGGKVLTWRSEEHTSELQSLRPLVCR